MSQKSKKPKPTTSPYVEVRNSRIHGKGIYAKKFIPEGARIIEYVGEKITKTESDRRWEEHQELKKKNPDIGDVYIFTLNQRYDIDGHVPWNTARLINHACDPNCESDIIKGKIWIVATRDIQEGEELVYNYGYGWDEFEDHPCCCGTSCCVGYILDEDHWPKLFRWLWRNTTPVPKEKWSGIVKANCKQRIIYY